ncbi:hypothetical protein [Myroides odoratus]|uniref:Uncharacterized protein n=1 Tax=Myroides odoratus TaxID=256 RepID=A0A9Q6Z5B7_MYROD|nr:hypothetical protein [Myroides odoratus]EHQ43924.1 hypothetical protein Myrod_3106 [Myroides odoratus DSM 2801]EKB04959.1 hypothetical protein HMPREF9716_02990 [Myroides odoratus CIP 103059]QQU01226.1 hypothetical protein I6I88_05600 [Myroides odoratus]WQD56516.1 hypothetical protein U0010_13430 [Myroides odoratus]STZ31200.1 Uncharacterised protein [Myroides odoratus]
MKEDNELQVAFSNAEAGWIDLLFIYNNTVVKERISHCFDPLPQLKIWLESIVLGAEQTSFSYDNEGSIIRFNFERVISSELIVSDFINGYRRSSLEIFTVSYPSEQNYGKYATKEELLACNRQNANAYDDIMFRVTISRTQLVALFYTGLLHFFNSEDYNPLEWEYHRMSDKLSKKLNLDYPNLLQYCETLSKQKLLELFHSIEASEAYWVLKSDFEEFENLATSQKKDIIQDLLETNANPYDGSSLLDIHSKIIENFLNASPLN